jgi:metal-responsive CopG/Arc/MetJ family transcriptional regulator
MKTAISVPNDVLELSEKLAKKLKVSRSKIFAMGVKKLAKEYDALVEEDSESITARINKVCEEVDTSLDPHWKKLQARTLPKDEWK